MDRGIMSTEAYFTHTTDDGIIYDARPLPVEFYSLAHKPVEGTPIRVYIIDPNEERKFSNREGSRGIYLSDDGEQGLVGYYDYQIYENGDIQSQNLYIHPFHRNKGHARNLLNYVESILVDGAVSRDHIIESPYLHKVVDRINERGKVFADYRKE
jgi:hypothetical protein